MISMKRKIQIGGVVAVVTLILLAWLGTQPFRLSEGEEPIVRRTRWIEVPGDPIEVIGYASEGQMVPEPIDFPEPYVSHIVVYLIWIDDSRTGPDTFLFRVLNGTGDQIISSGGASGSLNMPATLNNNEVTHVENNRGWTIEITCQEAQDGYLGPGGYVTIPDDGNEYTLRIEWEHFVEHNPDWL
jgi:hypothetical protein